MRPPRNAGGLLLAAWVAGVGLVAGDRQSPAGSAEARAVAYLAREVPRWKAENDCYSCHNNGDAARALLRARARGHEVGQAMDDTLEWLRRPRAWDRNKTEGGIDDKPLARIQFASALSVAVRTGLASRDQLADAAPIVAADQRPDGSWQLDVSQSLGSPTTYGTALATASARRMLAAAGVAETAPALARADAWLRAAKVESVLDAAAVVWGLGEAVDEAARVQVTRALETIRRGQAPSGGWGPYTTVGAEVFDTALVLIALTERLGVAEDAARLTDVERSAIAAAVARGRAWLLLQQASSGYWPETTRPAGQESYAQRLSTTGWALLALLDTEKGPAPFRTPAHDDKGGQAPFFLR